MRPATTPAGTTTEESLLLRRVADGDHREPLVDLYNRYASRLYGLRALRAELEERGLLD